MQTAGAVTVSSDSPFHLLLALTAPLSKSPSYRDRNGQRGQRVAFTVAAVAPSLGSGLRRRACARRRRRDAAPRACERRPSRHRSLAAPLAVQHERATARCGHTEEARRAADAAAATATRVLRCQQEGAARLSDGALRREGPPKPRPPTETERGGGGARRRRAPFFIGLIQKPVEWRAALARSRCSRCCVSRRSSLSRSLTQLSSEGRKKEALTKPKKVMTRTKSR